MKTKMKPGSFEIRNQEGSLDEVVVANPEFVHIEQMDNGHWWMRIDLPNGRAVVVNFTSRGSIKGNAFQE